MNVWCRRHAAEMTRRKNSMENMRRQHRGRRLEYQNNMQEEAFTTWFPVVVQNDINQGIDVSLDVQALFMPPSRNVKSYKSIYAYGNHIRVRSVESNMHTYDSGMTATFANMSCEQRITNLEYI